MNTVIKFNDYTKEFFARNAAFGDMLMGLMAAEIERKLKTGGRTPFKPHGGTHLRTAAMHKRVKALEFEVDLPISYAAAQEVGHAGKRVFRHYTTPGTGKGYFAAAVSDTVRDKNVFIKTARDAAGLK